MTTIFNTFLKKSISDQSVTFDAPLKPSKKLGKILKQTDKDIKAGRNLSPLFVSLNKMDEYLAHL